MGVKRLIKMKNSHDNIEHHQNGALFLHNHITYFNENINTILEPSQLKLMLPKYFTHIKKPRTTKLSHSAEAPLQKHGHQGSRQAILVYFNPRGSCYFRAYKAQTQLQSVTRSTDGNESPEDTVAITVHYRQHCLFVELYLFTIYQAFVDQKQYVTIIFKMTKWREIRQYKK